jgi:hypothetical protein
VLGLAASGTQEYCIRQGHARAHAKLKHESNPQANTPGARGHTHVHAQVHDSPTFGAHPCPRRLRRTAPPHPERRPEAHAHPVPVHLTKPKLKRKHPELEPEDESPNASSARSGTEPE